MPVLLAVAFGLTIAIWIVRRYGLFSIPAFAVLIFYSGFAVRMTVKLLTGDSLIFRAFTATPAMFDVAALLTTVALALFAGTVATVAQTEPRQSKPLPAARPYLAGWTLTGAVGLTLLQIALTAQAYGGIETAVQMLSRRNLGGDASAFVTNLTFAAVPLFLLSIMIWAQKGAKRRATFATVLLLTALLWFSLMQGRAVIVVGIWAAAYSWWKATGSAIRKSTRIWVVAAIPLAAIAGLAWRAASQTGGSFADAIQGAWTDGLKVISDSVPLFDHLQVGIRYADTYGIGALGFFPLDAFAVLVPREWWPGKPEYIPQVLGESVAQSDLSGLPAGLLGEGYMLYGWPGVIVISVVFGLVIGAMHNLATRTVTATPTVAWLIFLGFYISMAGLRTGAQGALITVQLASLYLCVVVLCASALRGRNDLGQAQTLTSPFDVRKLKPRPRIAASTAPDHITG